jgi:choline dehydrogenase-like flavoprotein
MDDTNRYDAIVVGSGMSGGWAAKELCEKGLKTLVLERGPNIRHIVDYKTALKNPWELPFNNRTSTNADRATQPIQSTLYLYDQSTKQHFVDDLRHPYTQAQPFNWYRGYQVGGRSLM